MTLTPANQAYIDGLDVYTLLARVRNAPLGDPWFEGETGTYWMQRLAQVRAQDDAAYVEASKEIGWS